MIFGHRSLRGAFEWPALLLFLALAFSTWRVHSDFSDAQLYRVVARHMVEEGEWLRLRYLPSVHPHFFEHLPFGLWPYAATVKTLGEWALAPLAALFSLMTLAATGFLARRAGGPHAGWVAMLALLLTEAFFLRGAHPFLEPPLLLFSTISVVPLLLPGRLTLGRWALAGVSAALACAVKGPFGLLPLAAVGVARAMEDKRFSVLLSGALVGMLAAAPVALFLALSPEWWEGYGRHQLLASALGHRADGQLAWYVPFASVAGRFWPGFPLLLPALALAFGRPWGQATSFEAQRMARLLLKSCFFVLCGLCVPSRKLWYHAMVVFPLLAAWAGVGVGPLLEKKLSAAREGWVRRGLWGVTFAAWLAAWAGAGRLFVHQSCVLSGPLALQLRDISPHSNVLLVSPSHEWMNISALAAERQWVAWRLTTLAADSIPAEAATAEVAFVADGAPSSGVGWKEVARWQKWRLFRRER